MNRDQQLRIKRLVDVVGAATGLVMAAPAMARGPDVLRPRRRRAVARRSTSATSCGVKVNVTTTLTPSSYRAAGTDFSSRVGEASELAAPTQMRIVASRSPS